MFVDQPILTLTRRVFPRVILCLTLLPAALACALGVYGLLADRPPQLPGAGVFAVLAVGLGAAFVWLFRREATRTTRIYAEGIDRTVAGETREMRWSDVKEIYFRAIRVQAGGLLGLAISAAVDRARKRTNAPLDATSTNVYVKLLASSGEKIALNSSDKGVMAAFAEILRRVNPRLVEEAERRVRGGDTVAFGPVSVSMRGLAAGNKEPVPASEIERFDIAGGKLVLKKKGSWLATLSKPIGKVPNVFALVELYGRLFQAGASQPVVPGRNVAQRMFV